MKYIVKLIGCILICIGLSACVSNSLISQQFFSSSYQPPTTGPTATLAISPSFPQMGTVSTFKNSSNCSGRQRISIPRSKDHSKPGELIIPAGKPLVLDVLLNHYDRGCEIFIQFTPRPGNKYILMHVETLSKCIIAIAQRSQGRTSPVKLIKRKPTISLLTTMNTEWCERL